MDGSATGPKVMVTSRGYWHLIANRLGEIYGSDLVADVVAIEKSPARLATLKFLDWLSKSEPGMVANEVLHAFREGPDAIFGSKSALSGEMRPNGILTHEQAFFDVFKQWCQECIARPDGLSHYTILRHYPSATSVLGQLADRYPAIPSSFKTSTIIQSVKRAIAPKVTEIRQGPWHLTAKGLVEIYGANLVADIAASNKSHERFATLKFLAWLSTSKPGTVASDVLRAFRESPDAVFGSVDASNNETRPDGTLAHERAFLDVFKHWCQERIAQSNAANRKTILRNYSSAANKLEQLADKYPAIPGNFKASAIIRPTKRSRLLTTSLVDVYGSELMADIVANSDSRGGF